MKRILKYVLAVAALVSITMATSSCFRQDMVMYEDGEFDGVEFNDYDLIHNAEIDMDDINHD